MDAGEGVRKMFGINDKKALLGRTVRISVGEPWNFSGPNGENSILGTIEGIQGSGASARIDLRVVPFELDNSRFERLFMTSRYERVNPMRDLIKKRVVAANFYASTHDQAPTIIGGLALAKD